MEKEGKMKGQFQYISVNRLEPNKFNPREPDEETIKAVSKNIRQIGLLQNLVVTPDEQRPGYYTIIIGEHRWRAATQSGEQELPCRIIEDISDEGQIFMMLSENQARKSFTAAEVGKLVENLEQKGYSLKQISERMGITADTLQGWKNLHEKIPPGMRKLLAPIESRQPPKGKIGSQHAQVITKLPVEDKKKEEIAKEQAKQRLSVSTLKSLNDIIKETPSLEASQLLDKAKLRGSTKQVERAFEGSREHQAMVETCERVLISNEYEVRVAIDISGRKPDVVGRMGKGLVFVECEALCKILHRGKPQAEGYDSARVLALPSKLLRHFDQIWFVDGEIQIINATIPGKQAKGR